MPRYWVIAPYSSEHALFDRVWEFDHQENLISIGWFALHDASQLSRQALELAMDDAYASKSRGTRTLYSNIVWNFFHEIQVGDVVLARKGTRTLLAIGDVTDAGTYQPNRNPSLAENDPEVAHSNFLGVRWRRSPSNFVFDKASVEFRVGEYGGF